MTKLSLATLGAILAFGVTACDKKQEPKKEAEAVAKEAKAEAEAEAEAQPEAPAAIEGTFLATIAAYNAGKFDEALEGMSDDIEWRHAGKDDPIQGKAGVKKSWQEWRTSFPDAKLTPKEVLVAGDMLAAHMVFTGTHKGEFRGTAPTDKPIGGHLLLISQFQDGKATRWMEYVDFLTVQGQIGALPGDMPAVAVPEAPSGAPTILQGEANPAAEALVKEWYAAFANAGEDFGAAVDKYLAPDAVHWDMATGQKSEGAESAKTGIPEMMKAFANVSLEVSDMKSAGDYVLASGTWSAKHVGDLGPIKASNKEFTSDFAELVHVKDGKIVESWEFSNQFQFLSQIGALPAPEATAEGKGDDGDKVAEK